MDNVVLPEIVIRNDDTEWTNCVSLPKVQVRLKDLLDLVLCWTQKFQSLNCLARLGKTKLTLISPTSIFFVTDQTLNQKARTSNVV